MLNLYFKFTTEKKWQTQNFDFLSFKSSSAGHFLGSSNAYRYNWISKPLVATLKSVIWEQKRACDFYFERSYDVSKPKSSWFLLNKTKTLIKTRQKQKWKCHTQFWRDETCDLVCIRIVNLNWNLQDKNEGIFCNAYFVRR